MDPQTPDKRTIEEIAKQLAEGSADAESAEGLKELLDSLAQDGDLESLTRISGAIREQFEAGQSEEEDKETSDRLGEVTESLVGVWRGLTTLHKAAIAGGVVVILLVLVLALSISGARPDESVASSETSKEQTPSVEEAAGPTGGTEAPSQPAETEGTPTDATPTGATPTEAKPAGAAPTEKPSPTPSKAEYTILACVGWQDDQEVGVPGSQIVWWTDQAESSREEMVIPDDDGCVKLPVSASPDTEITLLAEPPEGGTNLQIVGHAQEDGSAAWEVAEEGGALALTTTLGEKDDAEYTAQFLVAVERALSGEVLNENGEGIPGAGVQLWARADPDGEWDLISQGGTTTTDPDGAFVLTHTTGSPQVTYRVGLSNTVANRYAYTTTSVSGPGRDWVIGEDAQTPSVSFIETGAALGSDQLSVEDIVFEQALDYVLLSVQEAALAPIGLEWETEEPSSTQDSMLSKLITIDEANVDRLQARWEDIELPPGTYAMEIWTPENSSARVIYSLLSSGQVLDTRVSYQSTRQDKGQVNEWIDFSVTLNPSLIIELPTGAPVTVVAQPSARPDNREYNLGGNVVFGVGPVRFVKQQ